jgi:hypothetical protein
MMLVRCIHSPHFTIAASVKVLAGMDMTISNADKEIGIVLYPGVQAASVHRGTLDRADC